MENLGTNVGEYIERGLALAEASSGVRILESRTAWMFDRRDHWLVCALAFALAGKHENFQAAWNQVNDEYRRDWKKEKSTIQIFAESIGCDLPLARAVVYAHMNGMPARQIAYALKENRLPLSPADRK